MNQQELLDNIEEQIDKIDIQLKIVTEHSNDTHAIERLSGILEAYQDIKNKIKCK